MSAKVIYLDGICFTPGTGFSTLEAVRQSGARHVKRARAALRFERSRT